MLAKTLTEAQAQGGLVVVGPRATSSYLSSGRSVPYFEIYRERTALLETPAERIQRAGEDEAKRSAA